jgi:IK cytokine
LSSGSKPASKPCSVSPLSPLYITKPPLADPHSNNEAMAADANNDPDEDIFADAGSYKGFASNASSDSDTPSDLGEDNREEHTKPPDQQSRGERDLDAKIVEGYAPLIGRWFGDDPDLDSLIAPPVESPKHDQAVRGGSNKRQRSESPPAQMSSSCLGRSREDGEEAGSSIPTRLQPLSSSISITEILEVDKQAEADEKRKARKAKRKAVAGEGAGTGEPVEKAPKKKLDRNQKLQRDYQQ